jgi:hypothetical protein
VYCNTTAIVRESHSSAKRDGVDNEDVCLGRVRNPSPLLDAHEEPLSHSDHFAAGDSPTMDAAMNSVISRVTIFTCDCALAHSGATQ